MQLKFFDGKLQGDLFGIYTDFINCDIVNSSWIGRRHPLYMSIVKRGGYNSQYDFSGYEVTDIVEIDGNKYYMLIKNDRSEIQIKDKDLNTIYTGPFEQGLYERFIVFKFVRGNIKANSYGDQVVCVEGNYFEDKGSADLSGVLGSDYIYVYDFNGAITDESGLPGQAATITHIDGNKIFINEAWLLGNKLRGKNMKYIIGDDWGYVFAFATTDGVYVWHNNTTFTKAALLPQKVKHFTEHKGYLAFLDNKGLFSVGRRGLFKLFINELQVSDFGEYDSLTTFQDYIVLFTDKKIGMVKIGYDNKTGNTTASHYLLTTEYGIASPYSYTNYRNSLYVITSKKRLYSLNIIPAGYDSFTLADEPQSFFDGFLEDVKYNNFNLRNTKDRLYIFCNYDNGTDIYIYDRYRKVWLTHNVDNIKFLNNKYGLFFGGEKVSKYTIDNKKDDGNTYNQKIKAILNFDSLGVLKYYRVLKIILGKQTSITNNSGIIVKIDYNNTEYKYVFDNLGELGYTDVINSGVLGSSNLGGIPIGGENLVNTDVAKIQDIKIDIGLYGYDMVLEVYANEEDEIEYNGFLVGYNILPPDITEIENVYLDYKK